MQLPKGCFTVSDLLPPRKIELPYTHFSAIHRDNIIQENTATKTTKEKKTLDAIGGSCLAIQGATRKLLRAAKRK